MTSDLDPHPDLDCCGSLGSEHGLKSSGWRRLESFHATFEFHGRSIRGW